MRASRLELFARFIYAFGLLAGLTLINSQSPRFAGRPYGPICINPTEEEPRAFIKLPIRFQLAHDVPEEAKLFIHKSMLRWESSMWGRPLFEIVDVTSSFNENRFGSDGRSAILWYEHDFPVNRKYAAATLWYGEIGENQFEIDIVINNVDVRYSFAPIASGISHDFESIITHELGHALGLNHTQGTIMKPGFEPGEIYRTIGSHEQITISCIYGNQDIIFAIVCLESTGFSSFKELRTKYPVCD